MSDSGFREFMRSGNGKIVVGVLVVAAFVAMGWSIRSNFASSDVLATLEDAVFVSASTGESFHHKLSMGMTIPVKCPSGATDGYPAELCYWTKDGGTKKEPTAVLLKESIGKPGPTFCPDCGRLVVHHNPGPGPGVNPPPTKDEYMKRQQSRDSGN